jgi:3-phenylpropionate/cinnamic acid dioxygenase small subunit
MTADGIGRVTFEDFIIHEAGLLDARRFRDWMGLFAEDGTYWVPAVPDQKSPFDHVQTPPSRTAHLTGNVVIEDSDAAKNEYVIGSTVIMVEYRDDAQRVFAGRQHHRLRRNGDSFRIVQKRVDLINCDSAFDAMAVPI